MKIFGHCRFSYFGLTDTGRAIRTLEDAERLLWNPTRMAVRFHLFEQVLLPSIRHQTDPDFTFVVITSNEMPAPYRERLADLTADVPAVRVLATSDTDLGGVLRPVVAEASLGHTAPAVHFRMDDDDAVCVSYVERLRAAARRIDPGGMISFSGGVLGFLDGAVARHCAHIHPYVAIGLAVVNEPMSRMHPYRMRHARHANVVPSYMDPTFTAFHYTLHSTNNTSGYAQTIQTAGDRTPRITRSVDGNPELAAGGVTTPDAERRIAEAFPFTTGAALRTAIEDTARPFELAERLDLPRP